MAAIKRSEKTKLTARIPKKKKCFLCLNFLVPFLHGSSSLTAYNDEEGGGGEEEGGGGGGGRGG